MTSTSERFVVEINVGTRNGQLTKLLVVGSKLYLNAAILVLRQFNVPRDLEYCLMHLSLGHVILQMI